MPTQPPFVRGQSAGDEEARLPYDAPDAVSALADEPGVWRVHDLVSQALESRVAARDAVEAFGAESSDLGGASNVVGIGVGRSAPVSARWVAEPGIPALRVYLIEPMDESTLRGVLAEQLGAKDALDLDLPIEPVVTGEIESLPHTFRQSRAPGGISVSHFRVGAGTLGCLAQGRSGERSERLLILSNNHVLADSNGGLFGDSIVQPGVLDGGTLPSDQIAALERFVPIDFSGAPNLVDCATGWADPARVRRELVYLDHGTPKYFRVANAIAGCRVDLGVGKTGRTTQLTSGRIANCAATVVVRYGFRTALFRDQIEIVGGDGRFSTSGDSGSLIWTLDDQREPVGLLFAGGGSSTFANPISHVLQALDIDLVT